MNENNRRDIFLSSPFPWWEWDLKNNIVDFNDLKVTMLGYETKDFYEKGYEVFTNLLHPDDYEKTMTAMKVVLEDKSNLYQVDYRIKAANGRYHWYMDRGIVTERDSDNSIRRLRGIVIDLGAETQPGVSLDAIVSIINKSVILRDKGFESIITLCSNCQKVKKNHHEWFTISHELENLLGENISHGICPDCIKSLYPDLSEKILRVTS